MDSDLVIRPYGPDDHDDVRAGVRVFNAVRASDSPWEPERTERGESGALRHGWDGEPDLAFVAVLDGEPVATGRVGLTERDNLALAWLHVRVRPDHRRRGIGTRMLAHLEGVARDAGRTSLGSDCWDTTPGLAFAERHGFERRSVAVNRCQVLADVDWTVVEDLHASARAAAAAYDVERRIGPTPDAELDEMARMSAAINDAPTDDLDIEDEVIDGDRVRAYEDAMAGRGLRLRRVVVRHRDSGELAGHSIVAVDTERPELGDQHDTSVVAAHRGHRLGLLLKSEVNLWLRDAEPQLQRIDTWNAESNDHMISVNEQLGYRVLGRELQVQRGLASGGAGRSMQDVARTAFADDVSNRSLRLRAAAERVRAEDAELLDRLGR